MTSREALERMLKERIVAVVRLDGPEPMEAVARALLSGGVQIIEVALTTPGGIDLIAALRQRFPEAMIGAGTVLRVEEVDACVAAGAAFAVSPVTDPQVVDSARLADLLFSPGAYTPSEIHRAWALGVPIVKVFPAARVGPAYIKDVKAPMPFLRLMPTGGVDDRTAREFLAAGADVLGAGSWLIDKKAIARGDFAAIEERARALVQVVRSIGRGSP
jgi:2-dehydro-3-deoxyphosphogluconate aldolase/(4S)-4-hydroxy-2-oxoglutarate aldolase